ncbi:alkylphosphonate utilization protein [Paracoccus sp. MBLB3053]|uniref:Alkylphosphonate utilization protein n=1 Tax=Paracoccus aurantius TaxID=3073814 RepID=A0ABU2HNF2_9RHOB|nr:alkylphosphonate utilization protein [Paracoccus sp. MBLB3053]MDS9466164.1 alkylphosphonate utilization protein [Paracoccus sp. MBLB3053]
MPYLPPMRLVGATILREGELRQRSVSLAAGRITKGPLPAIDLEGYLVLPGIIDLLHVPARGSDMVTRLKRSRVAASSAGISTAWLAPRWSWENGFDAPASARELLSLLPRHGLPDLRPAIRIESYRTDTTEDLIELFAAQGPELAWFESDFARLNDLRLNDPAQLAFEAGRLGTRPQLLAQALDEASGRRREVPRHLCRLAEALDEIRARYGSVGDTGGAMRETHSMIGAGLAACPAAHSAAAAARAMGDPVLLSAADEDRLRDMLRSHLGDAIVSDGAPAAMVPLALSLAGPELAELPRIWAMLSSRPAEIMGLADRGRLDLGCRADLAIISRRTGRVEATICAGRLIHLAGEARRRFAMMATNGTPDDPRIAAE